MIKKIIQILLLISLIFLVYNKVKSSNKICNSKNMCIIENELYPELFILFENKNIIIDELENIKNTNKWTKWDKYDEIGRNITPIFTKMNFEEILKRIKDNENYLNTEKHSWRIFGLILDGHIMESNIMFMPNTMKLLNNIPNIINAGISCLEPHVQTSMHKDFNDSFYRCHIPLYIPNGDCAIKIGNDIIKWYMDKYFIFDDTCYHQAWNNTNENRFVFILDIKR